MSDIIQADANADERPEQSPYRFGTWYPIATAPDELCLILVFDASRQGQERIKSRYSDVEWWSREKVGPTHWMPLPPEPSLGYRTDEDADKDRA